MVPRVTVGGQEVPIKELLLMEKADKAATSKHQFLRDPQVKWSSDPRIGVWDGVPSLCNKLKLAYL